MQKVHLKFSLCFVLVSSIVFPINAQRPKLKCAGCKTAAILMKEIAAGYPKGSFTPGKTGNKKALQLFEAGKVDFAFTCKDGSKLAKKFSLFTGRLYF